MTENGKLLVPASTLGNVNGDTQYTIKPVKSDYNGQSVVVGRALNIESQNQHALNPTFLTLPLKGIVVPQGQAEQAEWLKQFDIYASYGDGKSELLKGTLVNFGDGQFGIQISITQAGTYTLLNNNVEEHSHLSFIKGFSDGTFKPTKAVTRAELATMLANLLPDLAEGNTNRFADVTSKHWASAAIAKVVEAGIMKGYPDQTFRPDAQITRAEMAMLIAQYLKFNVSVSSTDSNQYRDVTKHWAASAIDKVSEANVMNGYSEGIFQPSKALSRAEAVVVLNRLFERGPLYGTTTTIWSDVPTTHWAYHDIAEASISHNYASRLEGGENLAK